MNNAGANIGSTHYIGASMAPTINGLLQLRMLGKDHFRSEPRLARFAEFYMNILTPPEVRFGGAARKIVPIGDGSTEASEMFGTLATGFRDADPGLAARLQGAWQQGGRKHSGFFGTTLAMIDEQAPAADPRLGSANFPGYYSVLRHGWGTPDESAAWLVNGSFYRDHYHEDMGAVILYALGAPLSLDWGCLYEPRAAGAYYHSAVVPEAALPYPWDRDAPPLDVAFRWGNPRIDTFAAFETASFVRSTFDDTWTRGVYSIHPDPAHPILLIHDTFAGPRAGGRKVFNLNLAAKGPVETPAGPLTPAPRLWDTRDPAKRELASAGPVLDLAPGLNRLGFTGQWLIDWDLYAAVEANSPTQAAIGNWGHTWHPSQEQSEFEHANGRRFEERQHILRLRGAGPFKVLVLPYRKGQRPADLGVKQDKAKLTVTSGGHTTTIDNDSVVHWGPGRRTLITLTAAPAEFEGLRIAGGPSEVVLAKGEATLTVSGPAGVRRVSIPGPWAVKDAPGGVRPTDAGWEVEYNGAPPRTLRFIPTARH